MLQNDVVDFLMETVMSSDNAGDSTELTSVREILDAMINKIPKDNSYYFDGKYTVFTAIKSEKREVTIHIPFLYELLNPEGSHGLKDVFLKSFFKIVLHEYENYYRGETKVFEEYTIPENAEVTGRIDLYIESPKACYPIEIKIDAKDQSGQIERYLTFAKNNKKHFKVLYLTLHGRKPSKDSMGELQNKNKNINVFSISFAGDFYSWITECVKLAEEKKSLEVANAINQYKILIEKLTGIEQEREYMEDIRNIIKDNYMSAVEIERNIKAVRTEKLIQFISDLSEDIGNKWKLEIVKDDKSEFNNYYKNETYPGVSFVLNPPKPKKNITIYFRLEIDEGHLGYGVRFLYGENNEWKPEKYMDVRNAFPNSRWKNIVENHDDKKNCWLWWNNLNKIFDADFVGGDTADYVKLFDAEEYKKMLEEIKDEIDENMPSIMEKGVPKEDPDQLI